MISQLFHPHILDNITVLPQELDFYIEFVMPHIINIFYSTEGTKYPLKLPPSA